MYTNISVYRHSSVSYSVFHCDVLAANRVEIAAASEASVSLQCHERENMPRTACIVLYCMMHKNIRRTINWHWYLIYLQHPERNPFSNSCCFCVQYEWRLVYRCRCLMQSLYLMLLAWCFCSFWSDYPRFRWYERTFFVFYVWVALHWQRSFSHFYPITIFNWLWTSEYLA